MRKPQLRRMESQLRQARNRAARRCSNSLSESIYEPQQIPFRGEQKSSKEPTHEMPFHDREWILWEMVDTGTPHSS